MISDIVRGLRDIMLLAEKLDSTTRLAKEADRRSIALGERVARVEGVLDYALHGSPLERPRPGSLPPPGDN
jgi:hypothetical protein